MEKRLADFSDQQEIFVKTPTMQWIKSIVVNSIGRIEMKWEKIVNENKQRIINNLVLFRSFKQLFTIEKRWAIFSDRQKKKIKTPTMRLT